MKKIINTTDTLPSRGDQREIVSFDVFETLIVRALASPSGVWGRVGERLVERGFIKLESAKNWVSVRANQEKTLWQRQGGTYSLQKVYEEIAKNHPEFSNILVEDGVTIELGVEFELWRSIQISLRILNEERKNGNKIIFVSDGYFPSQFLKEKLVQLEIARAEDEVFSSCDCGVTKDTGKLYKKLKLQVGRRWKRHYGNNAKSDVYFANRNGLQAIHLLSGELSMRERGALQLFHEHEAGELGEVIVGTARLARLEVEAQSKETSYADIERLKVLSGVAAPVLTLYALWLRQQAERDEVEKLAFLSRDCYVVKKIFDSLKTGIASTYVYASRRVWHPPVFYETGDAARDWFFADPENGTPLVLLNRLGLNLDEISTMAKSLNLNTEKLNKKLDSSEWELFWKNLHDDAQIHSCLQTILEKHLKAARTYLSTQITARTAIVDFGWNGRLQRSLKYILGQKNNGYYLGLTKASLANRRESSMTAFLFDYAGDTHPFSIPKGGISILESFGPAPHGSVWGYVTSSSPETNVMYGPAYETSFQSLKISLDFFEKFSKLFQTDLHIIPEWDRIAQGIFSQFTTSPSWNEAEFWGGLSFEVDQGGGIERSFASPLPPISWRTMLSVLLGRSSPPLPSMLSRWPAAAIVLTPRSRCLNYRCLASLHYRIQGFMRASVKNKIKIICSSLCTFVKCFAIFLQRTNFVC